jgi:hypothetical protein
MKAIEINAKTDNSGHLKIDVPLKKINKNVRLIILFSEEESFEDEKIWMYANTNNPSFDFLKEPEEDIYSLKNGKPLNNEK